MSDSEATAATEGSPPGRPGAGRAAGWLAGAAGAGAALGFGELIEGASETIPSLVIAVGEVVTDYTPGDVVAFSIENVGDSQKTLLTVGVVVVSLAVGGLFGQLAARGRAAAAVAGFGVFGLIGGWAAARNPLSPVPASWLVALTAAGLGAATTLFLLSRARASAVSRRRAVAANADALDGADAADEPRPRVGTRRSFFAFAGGAGAAALGLVGIGRGLRGESAAEKAREVYALPPRTTVPASEGASGAATAGSGVVIEVPEGIEIPEEIVIEVPEGIEIPEDIEIPEELVIEVPEELVIEVPEEADIEVPASEGAPGSQATSTPSSEQTATASTAPPSLDSADSADNADNAADPEQTPTTTTTEPPQQPTTTTTQPPQQPTTTTTEPPQQPTTTTTEPPQQPTTTTTEPPQQPTTTTTEPPQQPTTTTTQPPQQSTLPQVAHLDTLDDEVAGVSPYITPISPKNQFYRVDTALTVPQIDPERWSLRITGMVDNPYVLTYHDIREMALADYVITLSCVSNPVGGRLVGNAVWTGVPLNVLLQKAGVRHGAQQIVGRSVDDFTAGFPTTVAYDGRNAILAIGMNNEPLPTRHGFPARLVVAGLYGYVSAVKWLKEIRLTTWDGFDGYWVPRGWSKRGPMKTQSRIDIPKHGDDLKVGEPVSVAGIAWAPTRGIKQVETKIGREDWVPCRLGEALGDESWVQWHRQWTPSTNGSYEIRVRATDGTGRTQSSASVPTLPNGAEGHHSIRVRVNR